MIKRVREIWLRFADQEDFFEKESAVYRIMEKYEGPFRLVFFLEKTKMIKKLDRHIGKDAVEDLIKIMGGSSVKIIDHEREFCNYEPEADPLERIAESLEAIEKTLGDMQQSLEGLDVLTECVSNTPTGSFLCVTGNISTCEE